MRKSAAGILCSLGAGLFCIFLLVRQLANLVGNFNKREIKFAEATYAVSGGH